MNIPIRPDQEEGYVTSDSPPEMPSKKSVNPILSKKKWGILVSVLCFIFIVVLISQFIPAKQEDYQLTTMENNSHVGATEDTEYQRLVPSEISTIATETKQSNTPYKERIEVPDNMIAMLEDKNSQSNNTVAELPLKKVFQNNYYTIQINGSSSIDNLMAFIKQHQLTNYQIYETYRDNKPWYVLIKGNYATLADAKQAFLSLPLDLQKAKPWIKSGEMVNKEKLLK